MSHIVSFRIEGLAGRKKPLEVELNRDTNVFFGLNGSGKTSLLKILHAAMANETAILKAVPFKAAEVKIYSASWKEQFTRSIERREAEQRRRRARKRGARQITMLEESEGMWVAEPPSGEKMKWICSKNTPKEAVLTRWSHQYLPTSRLHVAEERFPVPIERYRPASGDFWLTEQQLDAYFARAVEVLWNRYSGQVLRAVRDAQQEGLASILRAVLSPESVSSKKKKSRLATSTAYDKVYSFLSRQGSASILGGRKDFDERYSEDPTLQNVVQDIDVVEAKIKEAMSSRDALQELITNMFTANKKILFTEDSIRVESLSGEEIGLESLSSGEKHLLRILVSALLVDISSMLVDEPEISMHIDWQKDLIRSIRALNDSAQLIFATHSPEVMADLSDDKIFHI